MKITNKIIAMIISNYKLTILRLFNLIKENLAFV